MLCNTKAFARAETSRDFERNWKEVIQWVSLRKNVKRLEKHTEETERDDLTVLKYFKCIKEMY